MSRSYHFKLIEGCHVLCSLSKKDPEGLNTYVVIVPSAGSYTFTIGKAAYVVEKTHLQDVYKNRSFHIGVASLTQAYDMLDELDRENFIH